MIVKELDSFTPRDKLELAGRAAEEQMAFYLRRALEADKHLRVFNGLRLEKNGDAAQIDHLILHRYGVVIVESKSVTTEVRINEQGEWSRWFGGAAKGMASPILQGQRQGRFLQLYLQDHVEELLDKMFGLVQKQVGSMGVNVVVAISDEGVIRRPKKLELGEVCKADQVSDKVGAIVEKYRKANSPLMAFNLKEGGYSFKEGELARISAFLLEHHRPRVPVPAAPPLGRSAAPPLGRSAPRPQPSSGQGAPSLPDRSTEAAKVCRGCGSADLEIVYGRYGYYFKCRACDGNTPIRSPCPRCNGGRKVSKSGRQFFLECAPCDSIELFYTNPATD